MHEPLITVVGNLAALPRSRDVNGVVAADFRIASTPRRLDRNAQEWKDGETLWFGVSTWRALAENCAASLRKGDRVVVTGRLVHRSWTTEAGEARTSLEIEATSVGVDLSWGVATLRKTERVEREKPVEPAVDDEWASSGVVDPETGEVLMTRSPAPAAEAAA